MPRPNLVFREALEQIRAQILCGYAPGESVPSERQWSEMFGFSVATAHRVMRQLAEEGLVLIHDRSRALRTPDARRPVARRRRNLRVGLISRRTRDEWDEHSLIYGVLIAEARRRAIEIVEVPSRRPGRPTPHWNYVNFARVPWNSFDVGFLIEMLDTSGYSSPLLRRQRVLAIDQDATRAGIPSVCFDNYEAGWQLGELLARLGHTRFALVDEVNQHRWPGNDVWVARRYGFEAAVGQFRGRIDPRWRVVYRTWNPGGGVVKREVLIEESIRTWLAAPKEERPTALFVPDAYLLSLLLYELKKSFAIPKTLSVVTCGDGNSISMEGIEFTFARARWSDLARRAFDAAEQIYESGGAVPTSNGTKAPLYQASLLTVHGGSTRAV